VEENMKPWPELTPTEQNAWIEMSICGETTFEATPLQTAIINGCKVSSGTYVILMDEPKHEWGPRVQHVRNFTADLNLVRSAEQTFFADDPSNRQRYGGILRGLLQITTWTDTAVVIAACASAYTRCHALYLAHPRHHKRGDWHAMSAQERDYTITRLLELPVYVDSVRTSDTPTWFKTFTPTSDMNHAHEAEEKLFRRSAAARYTHHLTQIVGLTEYTFLSLRQLACASAYDRGHAIYLTLTEEKGGDSYDYGQQR
jgi:hypothetical protein